MVKSLSDTCCFLLPYLGNKKRDGAISLGFTSAHYQLSATPKRSADPRMTHLCPNLAQSVVAGHFNSSSLVNLSLRWCGKCRTSGAFTHCPFLLATWPHRLNISMQNGSVPRIPGNKKHLLAIDSWTSISCNPFFVSTETLPGPTPQKHVECWVGLLYCAPTSCKKTRWSSSDAGLLESSKSIYKLLIRMINQPTYPSNDSMRRGIIRLDAPSGPNAPAKSWWNPRGVAPGSKE